MKVCIRLAWKEFWLPFYYWKKEGCPGGRDFLWLTTLMTLVLTLCLLLLGSREGVLNRFVDVVLGKIPNHGVPIWVTPNLFSKFGVGLITSELLEDVKKSGLQIYPYREIEAGFDTFVDLPEKKTWKKNHKDSPDFFGWAVNSNDPLWNSNEPKGDLPTEVVLSRSLIKKYFDYYAYREGLRNYLPEKIWNNVPETVDYNDSTPFSTIWLRLRIGFRVELLPFTVRWMDRIPSMDKVAFLFPLSTYHALSFAFRYPELRYFPEANGKIVSRIKQVIIEGDPLDEEWSTYRGEGLIKLKDPLPEQWIDAFASQYKVDFQVMETIDSDRIIHKGEEIYVPCIRIPKKDLTRKANTLCAQDSGELVGLDVTAKGKGYTRALVYVSDRSKLFQVKEQIIKMNGHALSIHPVYQDALNRFGFLSQMIEVMRKPYGVTLLLFIVFLLGIQINILIGHRRHLYGMFLAKGFVWLQIYFMLFFQVFLSLILSAVATAGVIEIIRRYLQNAIKSISTDYKDTINIIDLNLLPLTVEDYLGTVLLVFALALSLIIIGLFFMPLRQRTDPAVLFQE